MRLPIKGVFTRIVNPRRDCCLESRGKQVDSKKPLLKKLEKIFDKWVEKRGLTALVQAIVPTPAPAPATRKSRNLPHLSYRPVSNA